MKEIRETCGDNSLISVRANLRDWPEGGLSEKEGIKVCKMLEAVGVDMIDVSLDLVLTMKH